MEVKIKKLHPDAIMPTKSTEDAACYDVYALGEDPTWIDQGEIRPVRTGLAVEVPPGYFLDIRPRSGLARRGLAIANSPGTLDSDYRGELLILLHNICFSEEYTFNGDHGRKSREIDTSFFVRRKDRIAQIRLEKVLPMELVEIEELSETERGEKGFGSTGR